MVSLTPPAEIAQTSAINQDASLEKIRYFQHLTLAVTMSGSRERILKTVLWVLHELGYPPPLGRWRAFFPQGGRSQADNRSCCLPSAAAEMRTAALRIILIALAARVSLTETWRCRLSVHALRLSTQGQTHEDRTLGLMIEGLRQADDGRMDQAVDRADKVLHYLDSLFDNDFKVMLQSSVQFVIRHWRVPLLRCRRDLLKTYWLALRGGSIGVADHVLAAAVELSLIEGGDLKMAQRDASLLWARPRQGRDCRARRYLRVMKRIIAELTGTAERRNAIWPQRARTINAWIEEGCFADACGLAVASMLQAVLLGDLLVAERLFAVAAEAFRHRPFAASAMVATFLNAVCQAWTETAAGGREAQLQIIARARSLFLRRAALIPEENTHRRLLLEAETFRLKGQNDLAIGVYAQALQIAHNAGRCCDAMVIHLFAAKLHDHRSEPLFATTHRQCAISQAQLWGANGVARDLARRWSDLDADLSKSGRVSSHSVTRTAQKTWSVEVSSHDEAVESSRLLRTALDNMSDGLVVYDANGGLLVCNDRAIDLFAIPQHLRGQDHVSVGAASVEPCAKQPQQQQGIGTRSGPEGNNASEIEMADGRFIQVRRRAMPDGGEVQIYLDVTEERCRERELVTARQEAERALGDLRSAQKRLVRAEKMASLGGLVAGVSHEIGTPLGNALMASTLLADKTEAFRVAFIGKGVRRSDLEQFIDLASETAQVMASNIQRADRLITSFKQVAVDQHNRERRTFNLRTTLKSLARSSAPMVRQNGHTISVTCPSSLEMVSVPGALLQVVSNLIANAVTHAFSEGQSGRISIFAEAVDADTICIRCVDDGKGIPIDAQDLIFDPFFTTGRGRGGSGLGLNIVYNLTTGALQGDVVVESVPGRGSAFVLTLPRVAKKQVSCAVKALQLTDPES